MGAHDFQYQAAGGEKDGERLFRRLSEDDRHENGNGAYTGDIGQKGGFRVLNRRPLLPDEVDAFVAEHRDQCDKWDPTACAATVAAVTGKPRRKVVKVRAKSRQEAVEKAVARARSGKRPVQARVVRADSRGPTSSGKVRREKLSAARPKVRWAWERHHATLYDTALEAAQAAGAALAKRLDREWADAEALVYPVAVLESETQAPVGVGGRTGAAYRVRVGKDDKAAAWEVEVEVQAVNPDKVGGWVFFGWCAS